MTTTSTVPQKPAPARSTAPALAPERPVQWPRREVRTLPNGLQIVLAESHAFPKIAAQLYFRAGNALVAHRSPGLASMTATVVRRSEERRVGKECRARGSSDREKKKAKGSIQEQ